MVTRTLPTPTVGDLWTALKASAPGDAVLLPPGSYGVVLLNGLNFAAPGVIVSPATPGTVIINNLYLDSCSGLHWTAGLEVLNADQSAWNYGMGLGLNACSNVSVDGWRLHGSVPIALPGFSGGSGLHLRDCAGPIKITNCTLYDWGQGAGLMDSTDVLIQHCAFHDCESDGVDVAGCVRTVIDACTFTSFSPAVGDHPDAIQFWGTTAHPYGTDCVASNNLVRRGHVGGDLMPMQGIFSEYQQNLIIRGNALIGTLDNGISVSTGKTVLVDDNFVQAFSDQGTRIIVRASDSVTVSNNLITEVVTNLPAQPSTGEPGNTNLTIASTQQLINPIVLLADGSLPPTPALDAWLLRHPLAAAAGPTTSVVVPPVVIPPVDLTAQLAAAQAQVATLTTSLAAAQSGVKVDDALVVTLRTQLAAATANLAAANKQVTALSAAHAALMTSLNGVKDLVTRALLL